MEEKMKAAAVVATAQTAEAAVKDAATIKEIEDLKSQNEELQKKLDEEKKQHEEVQKKLDQTNGEKSAMEKEKDESNAANEKSTKESQEKIESLEKQIEEKDKKIEEMEEKMKAAAVVATAQTAEAAVKDAATIKEIEDLKSQNEELQKKLDEEKKQHEEVQKKLDQTNGEKSAMEKEKDESNAANEKSTKESQEKIESLEKQIEEKDKKIEEMEEKMKAAAVVATAQTAEAAVKDAATIKEIEDLKSQNEELKKKLKDVEASTEKEHDDHLKQSEEDSSKILDLEHQLNDAEESCSSLKKELVASVAASQALEQQLQDARGANMDQRDEIGRLEAELSELKSQAASAPAAPADDVPAVVKRVFEHAADPQATAATIVREALATCSAATAAAAMAVVVATPSDTFRLPALWLAVALEQAGSPATVAKAGADAAPAERTVTAAYEALQQRARTLLAPVVVPAFVSGETGAGGAEDGRRVAGVVQDVQRAMRAAGIGAGVRQQAVAQLVYSIDATVLNALLSDAALCTCQTGMNVRLAVGNLEGALARDRDTFPARRQLQRVREASSLFVMPKDAFADTDAAVAAFSSLTLPQIARLLEYYHPDALNADSIDASVLRDVASRAHSAPDTTLLLDPLAWL